LLKYSMLRLIYNIALLAALLPILPWLLVKVVRVPGYAAWIRSRLAWQKEEPRVPDRKPCLWLHALSVGETVSARPLLRALRHRYPQAILVLSSSTRAGAALARETCAEFVDAHLILPYDLPGAATRLSRRVRPDLFILVETDFWPNLLQALAARQVPLLLVNGRMSASSWRFYRWLRPLVLPLLFAPFSFLAMQTRAEAARMVALGVAEERVGVLGNLKYAAAAEAAAAGRGLERADLGIGPEKLLWVAGSTHAGEEEIILRAWQRLRPEFPALVLVLAPRRVERAAAVLALAAKGDGRAGLRSRGEIGLDLLILDSYGELAALYPLCDLAFIGGSLVPAGGHNPLEAAACHKPVLFGPHMEDFAEISQDLLAAGGACRVHDEDELVQGLRRWLADPAARSECGRQAGELTIRRGRGVIAAHLATVERLL
jgi:3-deoxy-D-manno-octulosonic-acid transferase